ncbi:MAG: hypothetical protein ACXVZX_02700 [Terriglobales bacterium]
MKKITSSIIFLSAFALLSASAFAAEKHKSITLDQKVILGGQELKPGSYTFYWDDSKDSTDVTIKQYGKTVVTLPATVGHRKNNTNAQLEFNTSGGQKQLSVVHIDKGVQLSFSGNAQNSGSTSQPASASQ